MPYRDIMWQEWLLSTWTAAWAKTHLSSTGNYLSNSCNESVVLDLLSVTSCFLIRWAQTQPTQHTPCSYVGKQVDLFLCSSPFHLQKESSGTRRSFWGDLSILPFPILLPSFAALPPLSTVTRKAWHWCNSISHLDIDSLEEEDLIDYCFTSNFIDSHNPASYKVISTFAVLSSYRNICYRK